MSLCMCMRAFTCAFFSNRGQLLGVFLFLPFGSWELSLGYHFWWQVPVPTEPPCWPRISNCKYVYTHTGCPLGDSSSIVVFETVFISKEHKTESPCGLQGLPDVVLFGLQASTLSSSLCPRHTGFTSPLHTLSKSGMCGVGLWWQSSPLHVPSWPPGNLIYLY